MPMPATAPVHDLGSLRIDDHHRSGGSWGKRLAIFFGLLVVLGGLSAAVFTFWNQKPVVEEGEQTLIGKVIPGLFIHGDRELLTQLFANLIENAINHTPAGTRISVEARSSGGKVAKGELRRFVAEGAGSS